MTRVLFAALSILFIALPAFAQDRTPVAVEADVTECEISIEALSTELDDAYSALDASHEHPNPLELALPAGLVHVDGSSDTPNQTEHITPGNGVAKVVVEPPSDPLEARYCASRCDGCGACLSWVRIDEGSGRVLYEETSL